MLESSEWERKGAKKGEQNCMNISDLWQRFDFNFQQKVWLGGGYSTNCEQMTWKKREKKKHYLFARQKIKIGVQRQILKYFGEVLPLNPKTIQNNIFFPRPEITFHIYFFLQNAFKALISAHRLSRVA